MTNVKMIEKKALEFNNDLESVKKEIKRLQSIKCRLLKQKGRSDYEEALESVLKEIQVMSEVRRLIDPKEKSVTNFTQEDVDVLDYDETIKAIKSIQSKKSLTRWLTTIEGDNDEYREACKIENMLLEHKKLMKPVDETQVRKSDLNVIIETIENTKDISRERILEMLKGLI
jgi:hypothetical protein